MRPPPTGRQLVEAALADPPRRAVLASVIRAIDGRPPPPAQPITRWERLGDAGGITTILDLAGAEGVESAAYAKAPDSFTATEGAPLPPGAPFEELAVAEAVIRVLGGRGRNATAIAGAVRALKAAWPLFDRRPPEHWSAAETLGVCARLLEMGAGAAAAGRLLEGAWAVWTAVDRPDRIQGAAAVLRAL